MIYENFKAKNGYTLVKVTDDIEREIFGSKLGLVRAIESEDDYLRMQHKKIYGFVIEPGDFVDHSLLHTIDAGYPHPLTFIGPETVEASIKMNAKEFKRVMTAENERRWINQIYRPGTYVPKILYTDDIQENILTTGDKVYFHYQTMEDFGRLAWQDGEDSYWMIPYSRLLCVIPEYKTTKPLLGGDVDWIIPVNGWVMVEPYWGDEYKEIMVNDHQIQARTKMIGDIELVIGFADKPEFLTGILRYSSKPIPVHGRDLAPGTKVIFAPESEFENVIEGESFWLMGQWDIMAAFVDGVVVPLGDYVKVELIEEKDESDFLVVEKKPSTRGKILACGPECEPITGIHLFDTSYTEFNGFALIKYSHIMGELL